MRHILLFLNLWAIILTNVRTRYLLLNIGRHPTSSPKLEDLPNIDRKSLIAFDKLKYTLGHDLPIDLEAHRVAQERKLVKNLVERTGLQELDEMNKLQVTTSHKDIQVDNSINDVKPSTTSNELETTTEEMKQTTVEAEADINYVIESDCVAFDSKFRGEHNCIFPFRYKGRLWKHCTHYDTHGYKNWCSTKVDESGEHIPGHFGHCNADCDRYSEESEEGPKECLKEHGIECSDKKPCCKGLTCHKYRTNLASQCLSEYSVFLAKLNFLHI